MRTTMMIVTCALALVCCGDGAALEMEAGAAAAPGGGDGGSPPPVPDAGPVTCEPDAWYRDLDGDGHGAPGAGIESCDPIEGFVRGADDCDDMCELCFPGTLEICDRLDNDCDGQVDEGVRRTFYADLDDDAFGDATSTRSACAAPPGYVEDAGDCDDTCDTCYPGAAEAYDDLDNDCDTEIDEGVVAT